VVGVIVSLTILAACLPPPPPPPPPPFGVKLTLTKVASVPGAITMAVRPPAAGDAARYVGTRGGDIWRVAPGSPDSLVLHVDVALAGECGLLGMAFLPTDGSKLYVHYSQVSDCATVVEEYAFDPGTFEADPGSARRLLTVPQPQSNHNGGSLLFGPQDAMLYLALGDGGGANDGHPDYAGNGHEDGGNAQSLDTLLGKVLRIDPAPDPGGADEYTIPTDNPWVGLPGRDEIWSLGLRNPFRMSFDRGTGDLWIGDVGQALREEVNWVGATDPTHPGAAGANFGWNRREGDLAGPDGQALGEPPVEPVYAINRNEGDRAVVGGYVYRGSAIPELEGVYLFTDFYHSNLRGIRIDASGVVTQGANLRIGVPNPASLGEDNAGELYVVSLSHGVYRLDRA
jgi:glucose/arabinose dehydrogenase